MSNQQIQQWPVDRLVPYEKNAKLHEPAQIKKIAKSIKEFGWDQPISIDQDGVIIKGHGRRLAAMELGMKFVPVVVRDDLTPEQVKAARIADNQVAKGGYDADMLAEEIGDLVDAEFDIENLGFDEDELSALLGGDLDGLDDLENYGSDDAESAPGSATDETSTQSGGDDAGDTQRVVKEQEYAASYQVIIECADEDDQERVYMQMAEQGYKCKVLSL